MERRPLSLHELNGLVRATLEATLPEPFWLVAELSEVRPAASGHCYLEFVEKSEADGRLLAKASGRIWRDVYPLVAGHFERTTGSPLRPGMQVLVQVEVAFHELYGYALTVVDIDPTYTLGDMARRRQEILMRLDEDGVRDLNRELPLPRLLARIAVISSGTAAGYGDFCHQLDASPFRFATQLFPATMQGAQVEQSVIAALDAIAAEAGSWDAVVIIRGGGAVSDLSGFDTYLLAANVAQFPLPVLTGIGHDRDETVIDCVAHTRLKTPTAVADFLVAHARAEADALAALQDALYDAAGRKLTTARHAFETTGRRLHAAAVQYASRRREELLRLTVPVFALVRHRLAEAKAALDACTPRLARAAERTLAEEHRRLDLMGRTVAMAGPERILRLGYSITRRDGHAVRSIADLKEGDRLVTELLEGRVESTVNTIYHEESRTDLRGSLSEVGDHRERS